MAGKIKVRIRPTETLKTYHEVFMRNDFSPVILFCDTETDGIDDGHILEFAAMKFRIGESKTLEQIGHLDLYIKNTRPIPEDASKVNGITEDFLLTHGAISESDAYLKIREFMSDIDVFAAYNESFDYGVVRSMYRRNGDDFRPKYHFDVMAMCIDLFPWREVRNRTLKGMVKHLNISTDKVRFHNALDDIEMTVEVLMRIRGRYSQLPVPQPTSAAITPMIRKFRDVKNEHRYDCQRIVFDTDIGTLYFDKLDRSFGIEKNCAYRPEEIDFDRFTAEACKTCGVSGIEGLSHYGGRTTEKKEETEDFFDFCCIQKQTEDGIPVSIRKTN